MEDMIYVEIGKRIRALREQQDLSQQDLADRIGYKTKGAVNKIELGMRSLNQTKIVKLAEVLNTTPAYLMGWTEESEKKEVPFSKEELLSLGFDEDKVSKLDAHDYALIFAYIKGLLDNKQ